MQAPTITLAPGAVEDCSPEDIKNFMYLKALPTRQHAERHNGGWPNGETFNRSGFTVFFLDGVCGWTASLANTAENGRLSWRPGCVALSMSGVPVEHYLAVGGSYEAGAIKWKRIPV
jgi:hypothetical protein